jgi:DNA-binding response OmpR family regulator
MSNGSSEDSAAEIFDVSRFHQKAVEQRSMVKDQSAPSPWSYRVKLGQDPISLDDIEYRILKFLSSRPYHAFTPRRIAQAVTTDRLPVTEESLRAHITSLRAKLGFFADYVQTVPYIGYRFKA